MFKKRVLGCMLSCTIAMASLMGCGTSTEQGAAVETDETVKSEDTASKTEENEVVTIDFLHIWPEYEALFNSQISEFEAEHSNIKINTTVIPWDQLTKTLQTSFAGGDAPDVTVAWLDRMGGFNSIGACLDLTSYMEANSNEWKDSLVGPSVALGTVGDQIMGVPFRSTATMLAYNKTMLEENGWEVPTTLEEFEALNDKVVAAGVTPLIAPGNPEGFQVASLTMTFVEHELYKSGKIQTDEYLSGYMSEVGPEYAAGAQRTREWLDKGYIGADSLAIQTAEGQAQFYSQKGLFFFANNNELSQIRENAAEAGFEVDFLGFPAPEGTPLIMYKLGVDGFFVNRQTEHPDEAVEFLKYITSEAVQQVWADETLSVMANVNTTYADEDLSNMASILSSAESYRILFPYSQGLLLTEENIEIANFIATPDMTPEELGEKIVKLKQTCIDENG